VSISSHLSVHGFVISLFHLFVPGVIADLGRVALLYNASQSSEPEGMKMKTLTVTAPSHWASYLINGDASGLSDEERPAVGSDEWKTFVANAVAKPPAQRTAAEKTAIETAMRENAE
jgi:hypothetical protein